MWKCLAKTLITACAAAFGTTAVHAQSDVKWDYPHPAYMGTLGSQQAEKPAHINSPPRERCTKVRCLVVVNNTVDTRVAEVRIDTGARSASGEIRWSPNLISTDYIHPQSFMWWTWSQKAESCRVSVKVVIREYGLRENTLTANYEMCGPKGPGFLVIRDPEPASPASGATHRCAY